MRGQLLATAVALAASVGVAACSSSSSTTPASTNTGSAGASTGQESSTPYRVMVTGGLSAAGVLADNASTSVLSAKAGAAAINAQGGIDGHQVVVTAADDGGNPSTAVTDLLNAIHSGNKPDLYLDSGPSPVAAAVLPILTANHILSFNIAPTTTSSNPADFPLNFDLSPGPSDYVKGFIPTMKAAGYKKVGIIHGSDAYGTAFGNELKSAFIAAGFTVTTSQQYDENALSMTPELQAIQATKPDVLIMDAYGPPVGYLLKSLQQLGWNIPILADNSVSATGLISTSAPSGFEGTALVKHLKMQVFNSTVYSPSNTLVNDAVKTMTGLGSIKATLILAYNYDAFPLLAAAAKAANSTDPTALAKELVSPSVLSTAHTAMLTRYGFTAAEHSPQPSPSEFTFISPSLIVNGQFGHS
ncbi:amino acid ABC transporter substrate-binding protein [Trebonia kvetii]|uniref:Amino acid ABC transporter substrate-binding protein n=1 Tax=Trebonia kvetii TaxID=2480626 RepID=A0A6P2BU45_9ACTN|nr:ABC transporter substrate-binding protein [Trebonia kvetii]TVZ02217.1 amino acid ABC transporter substrate-binding protein [Trebonia kvetii]